MTQTCPHADAVGKILDLVRLGASRYQVDHFSEEAGGVAFTLRAWWPDESYRELSVGVADGSFTAILDLEVTQICGSHPRTVYQGNL